MIRLAVSLILLSILNFACWAQTNLAGSTDVPKLIKFSGTATDETGKPMTGVLGDSRLWTGKDGFQRRGVVGFRFDHWK